MQRGKASQEAKPFGGITTTRMPEIPAFSGKDANLWVSQVEQYFNANPTMNDRDKFRAAIAALEEPAFSWYVDWKKYTSTDINWSSFKDAVLKHFQPQAIRYPSLPLLNHRQMGGTVAEYRDHLETLSCSELLRHTVNLRDEIQMAIFLNGLREDLRVEPRLQSLSDLIDKAKLIEEEIKAEVDARLKLQMRPSPYLETWVEIAGRKVIVLVSTGVCESRIAERVVKELGLPVSECEEEVFYFRLGERMKSKGVCKGMKVKMHKHLDITHDFFVFEDLGGRQDIVLGFDSILSIGDVKISYDEDDELTVKLKVGGKSIRLKGDPSLPHIQQYLIRSGFML